MLTKKNNMKTISDNDRDLKPEYERAAMFLFNEFSKTAQSLNWAQETHVIIAMQDYMKDELRHFLKQLDEETFYSDESVDIIINEFVTKQSRHKVPGADGTCGMPEFSLHCT
jgi:hypothetical protein